jgi:hypothetical protein
MSKAGPRSIYTDPDKRTSLEGLAARVEDGAVVAVGGGLSSREPMALLRAILRTPGDVFADRTIHRYIALPSFGRHPLNGGAGDVFWGTKRTRDSWVVLDASERRNLCLLKTPKGRESREIFASPLSVALPDFGHRSSIPWCWSNQQGQHLAHIWHIADDMARPGSTRPTAPKGIRRAVAASNASCVITASVQ